MADRGRHSKPKKNAKAEKVIRIDDYRDQETVVEVEYEEEDDGEELPQKKVPKAVYRIAVILIVLVLALTLWLNRGSLTPGGILSWAKLQIMGEEVGEGFPVTITGTEVLPANFASADGSVLSLSNTALTVIDRSGREQLSLSHGFSQPVMRIAGEKILLYNQGGVAYMLLSSYETSLNAAADSDILTGAVAANGRYALGLQGTDGSSELEVYQPNGDLQYRYRFSQDYITAVALNDTATRGMVCTVRSRQGQMISKITVLDFSNEEPLATWEAPENLLLDAAWTVGGTLYAIGDGSVFVCDDSSYTFNEYSYAGRNLTAYAFFQNRAFVAVSAYQYGGSGTVQVYHGAGEPLEIELEGRPAALSVSGSSVGALTDGTVILSDYLNGRQTARADAGSDAKGIALFSESEAYILGASEIRTVKAE